MKEEKIKKAASVLVEHLNRVGIEDECDLRVGKSDTYKPFYRTCSILFAPSFSGFVKDVLEGELPTFEEALSIVRQAHPFYEHALKDPDEVKNFKSQYYFSKEAFEGCYE